MSQTKSTSNPIGNNLWDEILKTIVSTMPEQLFPLFKEVYGKEYPKGTPIQLISTEYSTYVDHTDETPSSELADIALIVNGTDYYHLECQMQNDSEMVIRMFSYDLHFAMQHCKTTDNVTDEIILHFPHSTVIYPSPNNSIPDELICRVFFQDHSEHIYRIPTVKIQSYSLNEIRKKHLHLFIPYTLLRFRPRLKSKKNFLTKDELTQFVNDIIVILDEDKNKGYITDMQYNDYINLFRKAANRIFYHHRLFKKEVSQMTKPKLVVPSMLFKEQEAAFKEQEAAFKEQEAALKEKEVENQTLKSDLEAYKSKIKQLERLLAEKSSKQ